MSRIFYNMKTFIQRRPLLFNSVVYGSFYTGAEFAQQSYVKMFKLSEPVSVNLDGLSRTDEKTERSANWLYKLNDSLGLLEEESSTKSSSYNWPQLKRYAIYGCFLAGPILHGWYKWLDASYKGKSLKIVLVKLFADQFILTPPLITIFFVSMSFMEGKADVFSECRVKFFQTFKTSCMYWLPVQFINFMLVPPAFRVSFVSIAAFCWVNILCYLKSIPLADCEKEKTKH